MNTFNIEKYINALNDLLGVDHAYFSGDENVDAIVELIVKAKELAEENDRLRERCVVIIGDDNNLEFIKSLPEELLGHPDPVGDKGACGYCGRNLRRTKYE